MLKGQPILAMGLVEPSASNMKIHVLLIRIPKVSPVQILVSVSDRVISDAAHTQMSISSLLFPVTIYQWPEMKHMRLVMHCKCLQGVTVILRDSQRKYIIYMGNVCLFIKKKLAPADFTDAIFTHSGFHKIPELFALGTIHKRRQHFFLDF